MDKFPENSRKNKVMFYVMVIVIAVTLLGLIQAVASSEPGNTLIQNALAVKDESGQTEESEHSDPLLLTADDGTITTTAQGGISDLLVPLDQSVPEKIRIEVNKIEDQNISKVSLKDTDGPQILIYHTHTTEAYRMTDKDTYVKTTEWRTNDKTKSVVAVGELLTQTLENKYGFSVIHDTTNHEPPKLATAYSRSLVTMQKYMKKYDSLEVMIDLHRDAYNDVEAGKDDVVTIDGKRCARVMFVVGTGEGSTGQGFDIKPDWKSNYALANAVCKELNKMCKNFTRPIRVKTGRYNQHLTNKSMLIEVGHNANTLEEAKNSIPYVAKALAAVLQKET